MNSFLFLLILFCTCSAQELCALANKVRSENNVGPLTESPIMNYVARVHTENLASVGYDPFADNVCNPHSWFRNDTLGIQDCCYPQQSCMRNRAKLLTSTWEHPYTGYTTENLYWSTGFVFYIESAIEA